MNHSFFSSNNNEITTTTNIFLYAHQTNVSISITIYIKKANIIRQIEGKSTEKIDIFEGNQVKMMRLRDCISWNRKITT